jgi:nucleotide-binding universal stress UspA family protein
MLGNILVGYDDSLSARTALQQTLDIAQAQHSWAHLVHVEPIGDVTTQSDLLGPPDHVQTALAVAEAEVEAEPDAPLDTGTCLDAGAVSCRDAEVPCTTRRVFGSPGETLARMARLYDMLVIGESRMTKEGQRPQIGANVKYLLRHCPVPLMVASHNYQAIDGALLIFHNDAGGGRAFNIAGQLCTALNIPLTIAVEADSVREGRGAGSRESDRLVAELQYALKAFHIEHEVYVLDRTGQEMVPLATVEWDAQCVIMSYPPVVWPWGGSEIKTAMATAGLVKIIVP